MIDILLCIASSASLVIIFKLLDRFKLQLLPVITINYGVAVVCSILVCGHAPNVGELLHSNWLGYTLVLGIMFVTVFQFTGMSTAHNGITVTVIAQKMSLVLTIGVAFILYDDKVTLLKIVGIILALSAIVLTTRKPVAEGEEAKLSGSNAVVLPLLVFFGSGAIDSTINFIKKRFLDGVPFSDFLVLLFGTAFIVGMLATVVMVIRGKQKPGWRELLGGILLGIPNYFSMHFLLRAFETSGLQSSVLYPVLNIGVVTTAALVAALAFNEKLTRVNIAGIILAIAAIAVLTGA